MKRDYALMKHMSSWLRHPVLGDPSFDTFERIGDCVHTSQEPFEWAVNGSLFRDPKDGSWYYYAGLYPHGYAIIENKSPYCIVYKSVNEGRSWECLGRVLEEGFRFDHLDVVCDTCPDTVVTYDEDTVTYWMAYDWCTNNTTWENACNPVGTGADSGGALAWAKSPAGPFHRLPMPHVSNVRLTGHKGRFIRMYATTLLKRDNDWISLTLCDSDKYYSWGLACMTAPTPEGPWSLPTIVLSVDRPEYYPAPVEFHPAFVEGDRVYAPATSVAASRNYQAVFAAKLEEAHEPEAWKLISDGNVWHSRPSLDEKSGIWGQTFHGFVHDGTFNVMYPSKNEHDHGTLFATSRPWNEPHSDGFTLSGHSGKSISPLLASYADFTLRTDFEIVGSIDFAFDYSGILGPDKNASNTVPHNQTVSSYSALRIHDEGRYELLSVDRDGNEQIVAAGNHGNKVISIALQRNGNRVIAFIGDTQIAVEMKSAHPKPIALIAHEHSNFKCSKFEVIGDAHRYELFYNGYDALLGAGQTISDWETIQSDLCISAQGLIGKDNVKAKWNVICDSFDLYAPTSPEFGSIAVYVDGVQAGTVNLQSADFIPSSVVFTVDNLAQGRHSIMIKPENGKFMLDVIAVRGG